MALLRIEGFNAVVTADMDYLGAINNTPLINTSVQRNGNGCLECNSYLDGLHFTASFTDEKFVIGFAVKFSVLPATAAPFFSLFGNADSLLIVLNPSGVLTLKRSSILLGTGSATLIADTWYYIEIKGEMANSTSIDTVLVVDGSTDITISSGTDTLQGSAPITLLKLYNGGTSANDNYYDDFYMCNLAGAVNNDFLGDCVVETLYPNGNGYNSDFVGSDSNSVDNYLHVDDPTTPDDDSSYIESSTVTDIDAFTFEDLAGDVGTIHGVSVQSVARKDDANPRTIKQLTRQSSTNYIGNEHTLATSYGVHYHIWETNPADAAAWEEADVNGAEFGIKVES